MTTASVTIQRIRLSEIEWDIDEAASSAPTLPNDLIVELEINESDDDETLFERAIDQCSDSTGWTIADCKVQLLR
jgi:hypothetical protein